jgi:hypothetical protein
VKPEQKVPNVFIRSRVYTRQQSARDHGGPSVAWHRELHPFPAIATVIVFGAPGLYITATMLPSGFLNATESPPLVAATFAPVATNCEKCRKT